MVTDVYPLSIIEGDKKNGSGRYMILNFIYVDSFGRLQAMKQFSAPEAVVNFFRSLPEKQSFKEVSAVKGDVALINNSNYLLSITK